MKSAKVVSSGKSAADTSAASQAPTSNSEADTGVSADPLMGADEARPMTGALNPARIRDIVMLVAALLVIALDQWTKHLIASYFVTPGYRPPVPIFGDILTLDYVQNTGVAFSMFEGNNIEFVLIAIAIAVIAYLYWRFRESASLALKLAFGFVLGGAFGNLIDRFRLGYVVDFIHFQLPAIHFDFAVFNFADSSICVGVAAIAFLLYFSAGQGHDTTTATDAMTAATPSSASSVGVKGKSPISTAPTASARPRAATNGASVSGGSGGVRGRTKSGANSPRTRRKVASGRRRG